jgi:hypothetical protein
MRNAAIKAGLAYFAVVFAAGFVLGVLREAWLIRHLERRSAELAEMPVMLVAIVLGAHWAVRRFAVAARAVPRLQLGLLALALMVTVEFSVVLWLRGLTLAQYLQARDPVAFAVYLSMLAVFALTPLIVGRRDEPSSRGTPG